MSTNTQGRPGTLLSPHQARYKTSMRGGRAEGPRLRAPRPPVPAVSGSPPVVPGCSPAVPSSPPAVPRLSPARPAGGRRAAPLHGLRGGAGEGAGRAAGRGPETHGGAPFPAGGAPARAGPGQRRHQDQRKCRRRARAVPAGRGSPPQLGLAPAPSAQSVLAPHRLPVRASDCGWMAARSSAVGLDDLRSLFRPK